MTSDGFLAFGSPDARPAGSYPQHRRTIGRPGWLGNRHPATRGARNAGLLLALLAVVVPARAAAQSGAGDEARPQSLHEQGAGLRAADQPAAPPAAAPLAPAPEAKPAETPWYDRIKIRGYTQFRYNRFPTFKDNDQLFNAQGDRNLGKGNGFSIRRARVILYGDIHERVSVYLQTDFASVIGDQLNVAIVRDWYTDIFLDAKKQLRIRVGQSKVPFGFVNLQSSQNRLPFDRDDAINSAARDERDLGVFLYWAPSYVRARFKHLVDGGLKGSGDYGVLGLGAYNGQGSNRPALTEDLHFIGRLTWPFQFGEQFVELGGAGYYGKYYVSIDDSGTYSLPRGKIEDARGNVSLIVYPQPFGFQAEGTYGVGPSQGERGDPDRTVIDKRKLYGGYAQVMWKFDNVIRTVAIIPFVRAQYYNGGKKFDVNVPHYVVKELNIGVEWQIIKPLELTLEYDLMDRTTSKSPYTDERGHFMRAQLQVNY